ncbi:MAG: type VI secretion system tube protein Hcp [Planctomycetota bacterium]|nr:type VI secretion system tube protein Hcp [Planctomycetota bacterium]
MRIPILAVLVLCAAACAGARAADSVYVKFEGISGEESEKGLEGTVKALSVSTDLEKSTTGKITSKLGIEKRPRSITIVKALDKATPRLAERVKEATPIAEVKVLFYSKPEGGEAKHYFTLTLKNATVASSHLQFTEGAGAKAQEVLTVDYEDIELVSETSGEKYSFK